MGELLFFWVQCPQFPSFKIKHIKGATVGAPSAKLKAGKRFTCMHTPHTCMHIFHTQTRHTHTDTPHTHRHMTHTYHMPVTHKQTEVCRGFVLGGVAEDDDDWVCELFQDDHMRFLQEQLQQPDYQEALCSLPSPLYPSQNLGKIKSVQQMFSL